MAIIQSMCTSFKQEVMQGVHNLNAVGGDTFKLALYTSNAVLTPATTIYSPLNEVPASGTYVAGGGVLTNGGVLSSLTTAYAGFLDISFTSASITAFGALIYNSSRGNKAVAVINFGANKTSLNSTFTVRFPPYNATSAIIRID